MVIYTNFASKKGRLLRKILNRVPNQPDFFIKMFIFLLESFVIGMTLYGATLPIRLSVNIDKGIVALRALDYLISSVPPAFPVYFTIAYSWSLYRLKKKGIFSTMP
jgi:cation-transporting ATPase 13A2